MPNHLATRAMKFHFSGTETCLSPSKKCALPHKLCSKQSQGWPCPKGHCVWELETNPSTQLQQCSTPKPSCMGQVETGQPCLWGTHCQGGRLTKAYPKHRRAHLQWSPNWYRGNQPIKEETKWLNLTFILFSPLSLLSLLLRIAENKGSSKAESISKQNHLVSILAKHFSNKCGAV